MKNKLLISTIGTLCLFILMSSMVNSAGFDNVKTYDSETGIVTVNNWYGLGEKIADLELMTPQNNLIWGTGYQRIAEVKISNINEYTKVFDKTSFYKQNGNKIIGNYYDYKYLTYRNVTQDKYKLVCDSKTGNGTDICHNERDGTEIIQNKEWITIDGNGKLPQGETTIGIYYSDVKENEKIEWIPTFFGVTIDEWASFTGAKMYENATGTEQYYTIVLDRSFGQTFIIGNDSYAENMTAVGVAIHFSNYGLKTIKMYIVNSTYDTIKLKWYPNVTQIVTQNITINGSIFTYNGWYNISFPPANLTNQSHYGLIINGSSDSFILWDATDTDVYQGGLCAYKLTPTGEWMDYEDAGLLYDCNFQVWGYSNNATEAGIALPPYFINITTIPTGTTTYLAGRTINATVTVNNTNYTTYLTNVSFTWWNSSDGVNWQINISNTTGKHSMSNATNVSATGNGIALTVPYNLTDYTTGQYYMISAYACNGLGCNQTNSSAIAIEANPIPTHTTPILNSSSNYNSTYEDLNCWNQSTNGYGFATKNIYNWYLQNQSIALLNLPFDGGSVSGLTNGAINGTKDYSGFGYTILVNNVSFVPNGGHDGFGAYNFTNTTVETILIQGGNQTSLNSTNRTIMFWVYPMNKTDEVLSSSAHQFLYSRQAEYISFFGVGVGNINRAYYRYYNSTSLHVYHSFNNVAIPNQWGHYAFVITRNGTYGYETVNFTIYRNGQFLNSFQDSQGFIPQGDDIYIGSAQYPLNATISDYLIFNRVLSPEQINLIFNNRTDMISSAETEEDDVWKCVVTPVSANGNGTTLNSTDLLILSGLNNLLITPSTANATQDLNSLAQYTGWGLGTVIFNWFKNGVAILVNTYNNVIQGTWVSDVLPESWYTANDTITLNVTATDSLGATWTETAYANITSNFSYSEQTYFNGNVTEGSIQLIQTNITHSSESNVTNVKLIYDNITYQALRTKYDETIDLWNLSIGTPMGRSSSYFQWNFTFEYDHNITYFQNLSQTYQQNFTTITMGNTSGTPFINFSFFREMLPTENITGKLEAVFTAWFYGNQNNNKTFNISTNNVSIGTIYLNIFPNDTNFISDAMLQYQSDGYNIRNYYYYHANFSNNTQQVPLYLLESQFTIFGTSSTYFNITTNITTTTTNPIENQIYGSGIKIKVTDENGNPKKGVYINIQRYYVGEDLYRTVAMGKTDSNGYDYIYLKKYDAWYRFSVMQNGIVIYQSDRTKISEDTLTLKILPSTVASYLKFYRDIQYTHYFNNLTNDFIVTYVNPSGSIIQGCQYVARRSLNNDSVVCNDCVNSSAGTLICNVGAVNASYVSSFYVIASPPYLISSIWADLSLLEETFADYFKSEGLFAAFMIIGTVTLGTLTNPIIPIIMCIAGLIIAMWAGMFVISAGIFISIVILGGIIIFKLRS